MNRGVRIVLSVDMEGISQIGTPRETLACRAEYWATGKPRMEAETAAAAEGLLAAGATEVIVLDNHGSGNPENVSPQCLPAGARLETWNVFDLPAHDVDGMLQVGYHARGGVDGFISHTYVPGLRLRVDGELISESHGRAWAAGVPMLGIVGNDSHRDTLGSLSDVPFLVVQRSRGRGAMEPVFADAEEGLSAVRDFAAERLRGIGDAEPPGRAGGRHVRGEHAQRCRAGRGDGGGRLAADGRGGVRRRRARLERCARAACRRRWVPRWRRSAPIGWVRRAPRRPRSSTRSAWRRSARS